MFTKKRIISTCLSNFTCMVFTASFYAHKLARSYTLEVFSDATGVRGLRFVDTPAVVEERRHSLLPQLTRYFCGQRVGFAEVVLSLAHATFFQRQVWEATRAVPYGEVATYRDIAKSIGKEGAVRAVGTALAANPLLIVIPCHRIIRSSGSLGLYQSGIEYKKNLLLLESS